MTIRYTALASMAVGVLVIWTVNAVAQQDPNTSNGSGRNNSQVNSGQANGTSRGANQAGQTTAGYSYYTPGGPTNAPAYYGYTQAQSNSRGRSSVTQRTISKEEIAEAKEFVELVNQLRDPASNEPRDELKDGLKALLAKQLDRDLAHREKALEEIERRAAELRQQLETRRENKEETLKLLMLLVENPSAGLGLPEHWMRLLMPPKTSYGNPTYRRSSGQNSPNSDPFGAGGGGDDPFGSSDNSNSSNGYNPFGSGSNSSNDPFGN